jgi:hypothetical protein
MNEITSQYCVGLEFGIGAFIRPCWRVLVHCVLAPAIVAEFP